MLAQKWPLGIGRLDYQTLIEGLSLGALRNSLRELADPLVVVRIRIIQAGNRLALRRAKPGRSAPFMEFHISLLILGLEEYGAMVAVLAVLGLLIGFTLAAHLMVNYRPHPPLQYGSGFGLIGHKRLQVRRCAFIHRP